MSQIKIRAMEYEDIELICSTFPSFRLTQEQHLQKWERYLKEGHEGSRISRLLFKNDTLVGHGHFLDPSEYAYFKENKIPEISDLWICEEVRGKGLGTLLIQTLEEVAKDKGYQEIGLGVGLYRDYGPAQKLYFNLNYFPDGQGITYKYHPVTPGDSYPVDDDLILWLKKSLGS